MLDRVAWTAQEGPQSALITCPIFEVFYGGARGGGKTDGVLGEFIRHADNYGQHAIGIMFRRERVQLIETIERSRSIFGSMGCVFHEQDKYWRFPGGARLRFAYLERDADAEAYQGHSYTRVYVEEIGNFPTEAPVLKLMATLRSGSGVPVGFRATGNPGGPGHLWVKRRYIDPAPGGWRVITDPLTTLKRIYIPSRVSDNSYLGPDYVQRLQASGSKELVRAWLEGDWNAIEGAFFHEWSAKNIVDPFKIPTDWIRFRSADWGSASPFSIGWWAVVQDDYSTGDGEDGPILPRGALVRYREWYGAEDPARGGKGLKLTAEAVGDGIAKRERDDPKLAYGVMDPSAFREDGGPSIMERLNGRLIAEGRAVFRAADNTRVASAGSPDRRGPMSGWDAMRARILGKGGRPMVFCFDTCVASVRTIPVLQHDPDRAEDLDCWIAGTAISTPQGDRRIEQIRKGDVVDTPIGPRRVLRSYLSGTGSTVWIELSDGTRLEGTPHHKIYIRGKGLVALESVQCHDTLIQRTMAWERRLLNIVASSTHATKAAFTTIPTARSWRMAARAFIGRCGSMLAASFRPAGTFITATTTTITTNSTILNAFRPARMDDSIFRSDWQETSEIFSRNGALAPRESERYETTRARCSNARRDVNLRADIVALLLKLDILSNSTARLRAVLRRVQSRLERPARFVAPSFGRSATRPRKCGPVRIVAVGRSEGETQVFNLTVEGAHMFYANGVMSSNTESEDHAADDWRYACSSRPWRRFIPPPDPAKDAYRVKGDDMTDLARSVKLL